MKYYQICGAGYCRFCDMAQELLKARGEFYIFCDLGCSQQLIKKFKEKYDYPTIPLISFKDTEAGTEEFIGGFTSLQEHFHRIDYQHGSDLGSHYETEIKEKGNET